MGNVTQPDDFEHKNFEFERRGSGVLQKGQHSWNISVTKEARVDPKVVLE